MTSAHTAIDDGRSYVFMSSEIENVVNDELAESVQRSSPTATIRIDGKETATPIRFVSREDTGDLLICAEPRTLFGRLLEALIVNERIDIILMGHEFKAHAIKVESEQAHLRILEG